MRKGRGMSAHARVTVWVLSAFLCEGVLAQQATEFEEEIIVRGEASRRTIRIQLQRAELAVYERFNDINSSDDFDIHCRLSAPIGSHIKRRTCDANFVSEAERRVGKELAWAITGGQVQISDGVAMRATLRKQELEEEMARLFAQDAQLQAAFVRVADLQQTLNEMQPSRRSRNKEPEESAEELLPFGATVMVDADIGRDFWTHELSQGTFTIADLDGAIGSIRLRCRDSGGNLIPRDLEVDIDVEWSVPQTWSECAVRVAAQPGTTFTLYEFAQ